MTGQQLKSKIVEVGKSQKDIADLMGVTAQSLSSVLNAKDVRSGTIERIAHVLNVPVSFFFDEEPDRNHVVASGDGSVAQLGNNNVAGNVADAAVLNERVKALERLVGEKERMIEEKERTIKILMEK